MFIELIRYYMSVRHVLCLLSKETVKEAQGNLAFTWPATSIDLLFSTASMLDSFRG